MKPNIYIVRLSKDLLVAASDGTEATEIARSNVDDDVDEFNFTTITFIESLDKLPNEYMGCRPWTLENQYAHKNAEEHEVEWYFKTEKPTREEVRAVVAECDTIEILAYPNLAVLIKVAKEWLDNH
jgi:hypothetical protein